ncbi:putative lipoyltransferase 2 [Schistosoma japonicum]|uniref:lipoyl(octanoyl) transferase n=2 Tax=Schistosoma japonicum TaxID=6182 RepID=A0A4Z2CTY3_SCHJA|nr:putative lipoyltransferase 2 [Schistosoma japonicum]
MVSVLSFYLGYVPYKVTWNLQKSIVKMLKSFENFSVHCILLLEHCPVYTIGIRHTDPMNDYGEYGTKRLKSFGAEFVSTDRGGLITYHGPGQLVAYPIINLRCKSLQGRGLRWYVGALEEAGVKLCSQFGVTAICGGDLETGVWLDLKHKIMAIGIRQSSSITYHGIALNCTTEPLSWLRRIVPCGLAGRDVTCLSEACGRHCTPKEVAPKMSDCLVSSLFKLRMNGGSGVNYEYRNDTAGDWCNPLLSINDDYENFAESGAPSKSWSCIADDILFSLHSRITNCIVDNPLIINK